MLYIFKRQRNSLAFTHCKNTSPGNITNGCSADFPISTILNLTVNVRKLLVTVNYKACSHFSAQEQIFTREKPILL